MVMEKVFKNKQEMYLFFTDISEELGRYGKTDKVCPACGKGIYMHEVGNSFGIYCKTDGCLVFTCRGL